MSANTVSFLEIKPSELDGVLALRSLLRHGLSASVFSRQVIICSTEPGVEFTYVNGVPGTSGLGPVTYSQDKGMRRELMKEAGIPVPRAEVFTMGKGITNAKRFAKEIGYPVTVKPVIGDNAIETFFNLENDNDIQTALDYLSSPTSERAGFTRAAYGLTELREPGVDEKGRRIVPPGYQFMVEKQLSGQYLRCLVVNGKLVSAIRCKGRPSEGSLREGEDVTERLHPELKEIAERAGTVIFGLDTVSVDMIVPYLGRPLAKQEIGVVELNERPGLVAQLLTDPRLALDASDLILMKYTGASGVKLEPAADEVRLVFAAHELPDANIGSSVISAVASDLGLYLEIRSANRAEGIVRGDIRGDAGAVAVLVNTMMSDDQEDRVMMFELEHAEAAHEAGD